MRAWLLVMVAGCAAIGDNTDAVPTDEHGAPLPSAGTAVLRPTTIVLPAHVSKDAVVSWDHVILPAGTAIAPRDVIVSGTGDGFIRRAIAIVDQGETLRVTTSPASLADAVSEATFHATIVEAGEPLALDHEIAGGTELLVANAAGSIALAPEVELGFTLDDDTLEGFELAIAGTGSAHVEGTLAFASPNHWSWGEEHELDRPLFRRVFALGPLPIVVVGRLRGALAASSFVEDTVTFTSGAHGTLAFDARTTFAPATGWTATTASTFDAVQIGPTHDGQGRASLAVAITARFELAFYGTGGATVGYSAQTGGLGAYCDAALFTSLHAGLFGDAIFELAPLAASERTVIPLWNSRVALDELETCAP